MTRGMGWAAVFAAVLAGCAQTGTRVEEAQLADFQAGRTTYAEVVARLGPPNYAAVMPDGRRMVSYIHSTAAVRPETFIPVVGPFVGGTDVAMRTVTLYFGRDGVLQEFGGADSQLPVSMGVGGQTAHGAAPAD